MRWLLKGFRQNFRDVVLTGFGGWIIWKQVYAVTPNGYLALVGLACMLPSGRAAIISILSEPGPSWRSSPSAPEQPSLPSASNGSGGKHASEKNTNDSDR